MTFQNSILAGTTLVREAISSEGYVQGSTGWTIERDGSAEFNDIAIRGTVRLTGDGNPAIIWEDGSGIERFIEEVNAANPTNDVWVKWEYVNGSSLFSYQGQRYWGVIDDVEGGLLFDSHDGVLRYGTVGFGGFTPEAWQDVSFVNGFGNLGLGFHNVQFQRNALGRVEFRGGLLKAGPTANGTVMFTLPAGYRPTTTVAFPAHNLGSAGAVNPGFRVFSNGQVQCFGYTAGTIANTAFSLDGHSFPLEA